MYYNIDRIEEYLRNQPENLTPPEPEYDDPEETDLETNEND